MDKWLELPEDMLDWIMDQCTLPDIIRMGFVCKSWLEVCKCFGRRQPQLPWLMMLSNPNTKFAEDEEARCFFSLSDKTRCSIKVPGIRGKHCLGSFNNAGGWLMTIDSTMEIQLFHPWRRIHLQLPHYSTAFQNPFIAVHIPPCAQPAGITVCKAAMSDDASVVAIINHYRDIAFCRTMEEDKVWTFVAPDEFHRHQDIIYHRGHFYSVDREGRILRINIVNQTIEMLTEKIPYSQSRRPHRKAYLVADSASESLFIVKRISGGTYPPGTGYFDVFEIGLKKLGNHNNNLVKVESLGDRVMFLGMNSSFLVRASQFPGFEGNCIYFTDDCLGVCAYPSSRGAIDMGIFNMKDKTIYPLFQDRAHPYCSPPIWISPPVVER